jgi:hypothetical protein
MSDETIMVKLCAASSKRCSARIQALRRLSTVGHRAGARGLARRQGVGQEHSAALRSIGLYLPDSGWAPPGRDAERLGPAELARIG